MTQQFAVLPCELSFQHCEPWLSPTCALTHLVSICGINLWAGAHAIHTYPLSLSSPNGQRCFGAPWRGWISVSVFLTAGHPELKSRCLPVCKCKRHTVDTNISPLVDFSYWSPFPLWWRSFGKCSVKWMWQQLKDSFQSSAVVFWCLCVVKNGTTCPQW